MPEDFLGQASQRAPDGKIIEPRRSNRGSILDARVKKASTTSALPRAVYLTTTPGGTSRCRSAGASRSASVEPSLTPSFAGSDVPE